MNLNWHCLFIMCKFCPCAGKKKELNSAAIEELKKQIDQIVQDLNLLKEQQALQTGTDFMEIFYSLWRITLTANNMYWSDTLIFSINCIF